ncbi:MAG: hypothetical protein Q8M29_04695 [Bacteroidota bacterium]|nr:hypothetical protein [Bacteroidota bacterium]
MKTDDYKLILNHLTHGEHIVNMKNPEKLSEYEHSAFMFMARKGKYLFEEDILKNYREGMTLEKLFAQEKGRFIQGANHKKDGKNQKTWHDISAYEEIERKDDFFDYFFTCKLRHIGLLEIDSFLAFHLDYSFDSNKKDYFRFLNITLRQYQDKILSSNIADTLKEWIADKEKETTLSGTTETKTKGKIKRTRDDSVTKLNQEQTALLISFLQTSKIILKEEYLKNNEAGQAFSILTGFSADSLRQNLSKKELNLISTKKNLAAVSNSIINLQLLIEKELKEKK